MVEESVKIGTHGVRNKMRPWATSSLTFGNFYLQVREFTSLVKEIILDQMCSLKECTRFVEQNES